MEKKKLLMKTIQKTEKSCLYIDVFLRAGPMYRQRQSVGTDYLTVILII